MANQFLNLSTDNTLGGNAPSKYKAVSEKAVKEYIDTLILNLQNQLNEIQILKDWNNNGKL